MADARSIDDAAPLDEVMLAMDVVDTLRHREHLVEREMAEGSRADGLIKRLKSIYAAQGLDVPDHILKQGVEALSHDRFSYQPPEPSFMVSLAQLYVTRAVWGKFAAGGLALLIAAWVGYQALVVWPAERHAQAQRIELTDTLPRELGQLRNQVLAATDQEDIKANAENIYRRGLEAAKAADMEAANSARSLLQTMRTVLAQVYELRIVSRHGEQSGVWRIPDANSDARNYYLIVEAVDPDGNVMSQAIQNEENGKTYTVDKWGVRIAKFVFDRVARDKRDDGIIQKNIMATKARGFIEPDYRLPTLGGAITEW